jgi:hypothetical protein
MAATTADKELFFGRRFRGGVRFRTLCADCNNGLGGKEDKALIDFSQRIRRLVESPIRMAPWATISAKPNLIYRGLLAHLVSANDRGIRTRFDIDARRLFFRKLPLGLSPWSLFYWVYGGASLFLMRNAHYAIWSPRVKVVTMQIIKIYPLAFMFVQEPWFLGVPNMRSFLWRKDEEEVDLPIELRRSDSHPHWPASVSEGNSILLGGGSFGLIGERG